MAAVNGEKVEARTTLLIGLLAEQAIAATHRPGAFALTL